MMAPDKQALKAGARDLVRAAGGVEAAAEFARPGKSTIADYYAPHKPDCFMPVDVVADLEAITRGAAGWPIVTRMLAARAGCALVALPEPASADGDWYGVIGQLTTESNDVISRLCAAALDGKVCSADVRGKGLVKECDDLIALAVNLRARFERIEMSGTG